MSLKLGSLLAYFLINYQSMRGHKVGIILTLDGLPISVFTSTPLIIIITTLT